MSATNENLIVKYWNPSDPNFVWPEVDPNSDLCYQPIVNRPNWGICISGGGPVSSSLIAGYFQALTEITVNSQPLMSQLRYISGVSGGCWGSAPYCYLPPKSGADDPVTDFYGDRSKTPSEMSPDFLQNQGADMTSMTNCATKADIVKLSIENLVTNFLQPHRAYTSAVGDIYLAPLNIDYLPSEKSGDKSFTTDATAQQAIASRSLANAAVEFLTLNPENGGMPYPIMNATMFNKLSQGGHDIYACEFTPLYSGVPTETPVNPSVSPSATIGSAFVESFAFNSSKFTPSTDDVSTVEIDPKDNEGLDLSMPIGMSGMAIESMIVGHLDAEWAEKFTPKFNYWNPVRGTNEATEHFFGDGGISEDTGIMALLRRQCTRIMVLCTEPFDPLAETPQNGDPFAPNPGGERTFGYKQIAQLFGVNDTPIELAKGGSSAPAGSDETIMQRQVFETPDFDGFNASVKACREAKGPYCFSGTYKVKDNNSFGVKSKRTDSGDPYEVEVYWVIVDTAEAFNSALNSDTQSALAGNDVNVGGKTEDIAIADFPTIKVFGQNPTSDITVGPITLKGLGGLVRLTPIQANLLGNFAYWMLDSKSTDITNFFQNGV